jgi:cell division protein FtsW
MVFSSSAIMAKERFGDPNYFSFKQIISGTFGLATMFIVMKVDYHAYRHPVIVFSTLAIVVAMLVVVFFVAASAKTHRWIQFSGFSMQPSEMAKLALIFFLAYFLEKRKGKVNDLAFTLVPIATIVALLAGLILLQPDLGTAVALLAISGVLLFVAGLDLRWIAASIIFTAPVFYLLIFRVRYRRERILAFLNPWEEPLGRGFQMIQSLLSVASGGITGLGFMEGKQKLFYLPEPHTDFIFAVVGEELGLIGTCMLLALFAVFLWGGVRASG